MGLWTRIAGIWRTKSSGSIEDWFSDFGWSNRSAAGIAINQISAMQVSAVMACVAILAEDVAKLPVHVYRNLNKGGKQIVANHPVEKLLQHPNDWQSRFEFWEFMMVALLLRGNGYAVVLRDGRGNPTALVPINPDRVWIYEAPNGAIFYQVARHGLHDMAVLASLPQMIPAEDVLHVRWLSMDNSLWGVSRIGLARESIGLSLSQQEMAARLSGNNTNLGGVLTTDKTLSQDAIDRLKKNWKDKFSGARNAGETAVLEQGLKWQPLGMTAQDAEFIASRGFQVAEIARLFRMPTHKLGVEQRGNGSSIEQLDQDYMNNTVSSYLERIEGKVNQHFGLEDEGVFIEFDVSRFLRASLQTRLTALRTGTTGGIYVPNEARRSEGLPDIDGGDTLFVPNNMIPIQLALLGKGTGSGPGSDQTGQPAEGGDGDPGAVPAVPADDGAPDEAPQG